MELKEGMYVRTDRGKIGKFCKEIGDYYELEYPKNVCDLVFKNRCLKASFDIIDLIEVGDYVNGYYVTTGNQGVGSIYIAEIDGLGLKKKLYEKDIKSIVTKEQFESISYKLD